MMYPYYKFEGLPLPCQHHLYSGQFYYTQREVVKDFLDTVYAYKQKSNNLYIYFLKLYRSHKSIIIYYFHITLECGCDPLGSASSYCNGYGICTCISNITGVVLQYFMVQEMNVSVWYLVENRGPSQKYCKCRAKKTFNASHVSLKLESRLQLNCH